MSDFTQDSRLIAVDTPLGKDELLLVSFDGIEFVSAPFEFQLSTLSLNLEIKPEDLIGKPITVKIQNQHARVFNGFVKSFSFGEIKSSGFREYKLVMVPWLWFLSKTEGRRIFQNKNTKDIVTQVFSDLGFNDFDFKAAGGTPREYCVQYGESDMQFVSRLLAEEGYAYYFKHEEAKHTLVIVDKANAYDECLESNLTYSKGSTPDSQILDWQHDYEFRTGSWAINDFNFKEPKKKLVAEASSKSKFANNSKFAHYEYPDLYEFGAGSDLVKVRMDAEEVQMNTIKGRSNCSTFYTGGFFTLEKHDTKSEQGSYILLSVEHHAYDSSYYTGEAGESYYQNGFTCIPSDVHFRPKQSVPRPVMNGPQSAIVTGPAGEEIYIDEFGRIKVQFIWDREGKNDENSTCFLRVMQSMAGNGWGSSFIPRIGHEVIVSFLDGNPDRPIVTGAVYNGVNKPPYSSKTQSGIKTHSTKSGSAANYNELRFDDKKGAEQVYIHAEKNLDTMVENNETLTVDNDRTKRVKHDEHATIENDRIKQVNHDENSTIENNRNKTVNNNQTETIKNNKTITVGKNHKEDIKANMTIQIDKDLKETVTGKYLEDVNKSYRLNAQTITFKADEKIVIQTGTAKIVMTNNGDITISGNTINVKASSNVVIKGSKVITN